MKRIGFISGLLLLGNSLALGAPLATAARSVMPKETQQIISVDYRTLQESPSAMVLKNRVLPPNLKEFESAMESLGLNPDTDIESLTFATYRSSPKGGGLRLIGIAQGQFATAKLLQRLKAQKITPKKYHESLIYPSAAGMQMTFLDDFTMLFGDDAAIQGALDSQDGYTDSLASNAQLTDALNGADTAPAVWSVLDQQGTQNLLRSALGAAAGLADYDTVKQRMLSSRYAMDFTNGVSFDLDVTTSDSLTATALSSLVKAGMLYRRVTAAGADKLAMDNTSVNSDGDRLRIHCQANQTQFQSLLQSDLFAAVAR